jgi:hypothetical protein
VENDDGIFGGHPAHPVFGNATWIHQNQNLYEWFNPWTSNCLRPFKISTCPQRLSPLFFQRNKFTNVRQCQHLHVLNRTWRCPKPCWKISRGLHKTGKDSGSHVRTCGQRPVVQIKSVCIPSSKTLKFAKGQSQLLWREFQFMNCYELFMNYSWVQKAGHSTLLSMMYQTRGFWGCQRFRRTAKAPKM